MKAKKIEEQILRAAYASDRATLAACTAVGGILVFALTFLLQVVSGFRISPGIGLFALFLPAPWLFVTLTRWAQRSGELDLLLSEDGSDVDTRLSPTMIGPLLEIVGGEVGVQSNFRMPLATLRSLLLTVREEDSVMLTPKQRKYLHTLTQERFRHIDYPPSDVHLREASGDLCMAAVSALGVLGNSASIPMLERFARKTNRPEFQAATRRSIEQIRGRMHYGSEQLLRAGAAPEPPNTLLRTVSTVSLPDSHPEQLLRADTTVFEDRSV